MKLLEGVRVVEFGIAAAGPACTKILAEYGAEVIVCEPIAGGTTRWMTSFYDFWGGNKKSVPVDAKSPEGMEMLMRLVASADVFLSNYRVKSLNKLGLDYESLKKVNPKLIYALMLGWGLNGPKKDDPAYDIVAFWARGGYLRDVAEKGSICVPPQGVGDCAAAQALSSGICAALYNREKTGEGAKVTISIYGEAVYLNNFQSINAQFGEEYPKSRLKAREALCNTYQCKDGWVVFFDNQFDRHFWKLLEAVGRGDLVGDPRWNNINDTRLEKAPELIAILDEAFSKMTQQEAVDRLSAIDIAIEKCYGSVDAMSDPQCLENRYVFDWTLSSGPHEGETVKMPVNPVYFNDEYACPDFQRGPRLGENTLEILKTVGYSEDEIRALAEKKVTVVGQ